MNWGQIYEIKFEQPTQGCQATGYLVPTVPDLLVAAIDVPEAYAKACQIRGCIRIVSVVQVLTGVNY